MFSDTIVLIPSLNEAQSIGNTIAEVKECVPGATVVVIDSHSTDGTARIAQELGAVVLDVPKLGKGRALRDGLGILKRSTYSAEVFYYVMLDADYTYPARHIPEILSELESGADVVLGYRKWKAKGSMTFTNKIGNLALSLLASCCYWVYVRDVCTGLWGFRTDALNRFELCGDGFTLEADLFGTAARSKCVIRQIPITYRARNGSKPKLKVRDGFEIGRFLIANAVKGGRNGG